jgi:hypothetical protein
MHDLHYKVKMQIDKENGTQEKTKDDTEMLWHKMSSVG